MFTSILSAISAIPELIKSIQSLIGWFQKANEEKWFEKSTISFDRLKDAKTDKEKLDAVKDIQDLIRNL